MVRQFIRPLVDRCIYWSIVLKLRLKSETNGNQHKIRDRKVLKGLFCEQVHIRDVNLDARHP